MSESLGAAQREDGASATGPSASMGDDTPPPPQERARRMREARRDDIPRADVGPHMPVDAAVVSPRFEVTSVGAIPQVHVQVSETHSPVQASPPHSRPATDAAASPHAHAPKDVRPVPPGSPPRTSARRDAVGPHLTVNSLNVQVVNEERPTRKPPRREPASASRPSEDWARFERHHLRVP